MSGMEQGLRDLWYCVIPSPYARQMGMGCSLGPGQDGSSFRASSVLCFAFPFVMTIAVVVVGVYSQFWGGHTGLGT